jgi:hypothetical protein
MTNPDCDVCRGDGQIRVPLYTRMKAVQLRDRHPDPIPSHEMFPCPKCSDMVPVQLLHAQREMVHFQIPEDLKHVAIEGGKHDLAHMLAKGLLDRGFLKFQETRNSQDVYYEFSMRATVAVVRPDRLADLEKEIAKRQEEVAREAIDEACQQIDNWGSYYGQNYYGQDVLSKKMAKRMIKEALAVVLRHRARKWKDVE